MVFDLTEEQRMIQETARNFALKEVLPKAAELDETGKFPRNLSGIWRISGSWAWRSPRSTAARGWTTSATQSRWRRSPGRAPPPA